MDAARPGRNYLCSQTHKIINRPADARFISRNRRCGNNDRISGMDLHLPVASVRHTGQSCHRFALAPRREDADSVIAIMIELLRFNKCAFRSLKVTHFKRDTHHIDHGTAEDTNFSFIFNSRINRHLYAGHIGRECGKNDTSPDFVESISKRLGNHCFRQSISRILGIRGIGAEDKHTVAAKLGELMHIRLFSVHRGMIKFKITCMHHSSYRRTDINTAGIRNGMTYMEETEPERTASEFIACLYYIQIVLSDFLFLQLAFNQAAGQPRRIDRSGNITQ